MFYCLPPPFRVFLSPCAKAGKVRTTLGDERTTLHSQKKGERSWAPAVTGEKIGRRGTEMGKKFPLFSSHLCFFSPFSLPIFCSEPMQ